MITVVMPFYKKARELIYSFENHTLHVFNQFKDRLELILSMDDPEESNQILSFFTLLAENQRLGFFVKIFINQEAHLWRCPSKAINVGIKQARYENILVMSPETLPLPHSIEQLLSHCTPSQYAVGIIKHSPFTSCSFDNLPQLFADLPGTILPYGSICFRKEQAIAIGGYDEKFVIWGGDDDDFRARLEKAHYKRVQTFAKFIHVSFPSIKNGSPDKAKRSKDTQAIINMIRDNPEVVANQGIFGHAFDTVAFEFDPYYSGVLP